MQEKVLKVNKSVLYQGDKQNEDDLFFINQAPRITLTAINEEIIKKNQKIQQQEKPLQINQKTQNPDFQSAQQIRLKLIHTQGQLRRIKQKYETQVEQKNFISQQLKRLKNTFTQLQKENQSLSKKIFYLEENLNYQGIQLSQKQNLQNKIRHLQIQKRQLELKAFNLQLKQEELQKLQINHLILNLKCQNLIENNKEYEIEFQSLKAYIREFQDCFYRRKQKKVLPYEIRNLLSETQQKMEKINKKIDQLQIYYYQEQQKMFIRQKNNVNIQYGKLAKQKADDINKKVQITIEIRQDLIKQSKRQLEKQQNIKVKALQKKIEDYQNKIHNKKMNKNPKMLKQRVAEIQKKIFSLSNSQFITNKHLEKIIKNTSQTQNKQTKYENGQTNHLKSTSKESQLNYQKKTQLQQKYQNKTAANTLFESKQGSEKYMIKVSMSKQSDIKDRNDNKTQTKNEINEERSSYIRPQINIKTNANDDDVKNSQKQELQYMMMEIDISRKKINLYQQERIQFRLQSQKLFTKNQKLYEQLQNTKRALYQSQKKLQQLKNAKYSKIQRLQAQLQAQKSYYVNLLEEKTSVNASLQNETISLRERCLILSKNQAFLFASAKMLKEQLRFNNSNLTSQMGVQTVKNILKIQDCKNEIHLLEQKIQQQSKQLQNYLGENLQLTIKIQQNQQRLKQLQERVNNQAQLIIQKQTELVNIKNTNLFKSNNLKNTIIDLEKKINILLQQDSKKSQNIKQQKQEIKALTRQNKKYLAKIDTLKQQNQFKIQKLQKKYKKLQNKYFGLETVLQSSQKSDKNKKKLKNSQIENDKNQINKNKSDSNFNSKSLNSYKMSQLSESIIKQGNKKQFQQFFNQNSQIMSVLSIDQGQVQKQNIKIHFQKDKIK